VVISCRIPSRGHLARRGDNGRVICPWRSGRPLAGRRIGHRGCTRVRGRRGKALVVAALGLAGSLGFTGGAGAANSVPPYSDPNAVGSIGLCNQAGQQITSGSLTTKPFAWRAVSTQPAPAPYNNAGRTATLVVYQPQQGLPPGDWSGAQMTSSSRYTNAANPMAAATSGDQSLQDIVEEYPPKWNGFLQLRIYLGTTNQQTYSEHYPALDIQVTGNTWQAVGGSPVDCASGTSESLESLLLPSASTSTTVPPTTAATTPTGSDETSSAGTSPENAGSSESGGDAGSQGKNDGALASAAPAAHQSESASDSGLIIALIVCAVAVVAAAFLVLRRRRLTSDLQVPDASADSETASSTKGN
jgi:hypothetical protein